MNPVQGLRDETGRLVPSRNSSRSNRTKATRSLIPAIVPAPRPRLSPALTDEDGRTDSQRGLRPDRLGDSEHVSSTLIGRRPSFNPHPHISPHFE